MSAATSDALAGALARVGDRWSLLVVDALSDGPRRFGDLEAALPGIATNVLTQRLRRLEADRVVMAVPYSTRPRRFAYELTEAGGPSAGRCGSWPSGAPNTVAATPTRRPMRPAGRRWWPAGGARRAIAERTGPS